MRGQTLAPIHEVHKRFSLDSGLVADSAGMIVSSCQRHAPLPRSSFSFITSFLAVYIYFRFGAPGTFRLGLFRFEFIDLALFAFLCVEVTLGQGKNMMLFNIIQSKTIALDLLHVGQQLTLESVHPFLGFILTRKPQALQSVQHSRGSGSSWIIIAAPDTSPEEHLAGVDLMTQSPHFTGSVNGTPWPLSCCRRRLISPAVGPTPA